MTTREEYISENREELTGLSYFVHDGDSLLHPEINPSPALDDLRGSLNITSFKTEMPYSLYDGYALKYTEAYSLYVIGQINLDEGREVLAQVVPRWRLFTNKPETTLTILNVEPVFGSYG